MRSYTLAVALVALAAANCNIFNDYGNAACKQNPAWCAATGGAGGGSTGLVCQGAGTIFACNVENAQFRDTSTDFSFFQQPGCGLGFCAASTIDAKTQAAAFTGVDPNNPWLVCLNTGTTTEAGFKALFQAIYQIPGVDPNDFESLCVAAPGTTTCGNPCDDGAGGTLQSPGQLCHGLSWGPGGYNCCDGLTCIDPSTGQPPSMNTGWAQAYCQGTIPKCASGAPPQPNWIGLDTATLRNICINNNINGSASQSGITLNRTCGVAFETWVLKTMGWLPRWTTLIPSTERKNQNLSKGGLPASVIPEQVLDQSSFMSWVEFPRSVFVEVKAVNGTLTLGTSQYQILGLLDGVNTWPPVPDAGAHAPPAVFFITTSNTAISQSPQQVVDKATAWKVGVWQQFVYYDANGGINPTLSVGDPTNPGPSCLNPAVYSPYSTTYKVGPGPRPQNPLTWATEQEQDAVGAVPDPDSPEMVP